MRLLSLNVLHGGGTRVDRLIAAIGAHRPDIVVLPEFRRCPSGDRLLAGLAGIGLAFAADSDPRRGCNGVAIASNAPFSATGCPLTEYDSRERVLEMTVDGLTIGGVYFPLKAPHAAFWQREFTAFAASRIDRPYVFIGDWNTGLAVVDQTGPRLPGTVSFTAMGLAGWTDAWRTLHVIDREHTWFNWTGNGFRLDHALLSPPAAARLQRAFFSHEPRLDRTSDHSALVVDLE